jgi:hypothetical protein
MEIHILGIDLARHVFQLHGADRRGRAVHRAKASRGSLFQTVRTLKPRMVVMDACSTAHHWARRFQSLSIEVRLINPQYVAPFVKTNKNDRSDAEAIVEAACRPTMRFVTIKSVEQQDIQAAHRMRAILVRPRPSPPQTDPTPQANSGSGTSATRSAETHPLSAATAFANTLAAARVHHEKRAATAPLHAPRARCLHPLSCEAPERPRRLVLALFYGRAWVKASGWKLHKRRYQW